MPSVQVRIPKVWGKKVKVSVEGAEGAACLSVTEALRKAIGAGTLERTAAFYKEEQEVHIGIS